MLLVLLFGLISPVGLYNQTTELFSTISLVNPTHCIHLVGILINPITYLLILNNDFTY